MKPQSKSLVVALAGMGFALAPSVTAEEVSKYCNGAPMRIHNGTKWVLAYPNGKPTEVFNGTKWVSAYPNGKPAEIFDGTKWVSAFSNGKATEAYNGSFWVKTFPNGAHTLLSNGTGWVMSYPNGQKSQFHNGTKWVMTYPNGKPIEIDNGSMWVAAYPNGNPAKVYNGSSWVFAYENGKSIGSCGTPTTVPCPTQARIRTEVQGFGSLRTTLKLAPIGLEGLLFRTQIEGRRARFQLDPATKSLGEITEEYVENGVYTHVTFDPLSAGLSITETSCDVPIWED